jgi:hypothetical protein
MKVSLSSQGATVFVRLVALVASAMLLASCATGTKPPPPPTVPLSRVGVLPLKMWPANGDAVSFNGYSSTPGGVVFVPLNAAAVPTAAIGTGLSLLLSLPRRKLAEGVATVQFDALAAFQKRLWPALLAQNLPVVTINNPAVVAALRAGDLKAISAEVQVQSLPGVDAVLDVQITAAGYYPSGNAGGYSPMMYVVAKLLLPNKPAEEIVRFNYDADYRPAEGESRFFTTPKQISADTPDAIRANADLIRTEMDSIAARMVERMVIDIGRRIRNEATLP